MARRTLEEDVSDEIIRKLEKFKGFFEWYWSLEPAQQYEVKDVVCAELEAFDYKHLSAIESWSNESICY